MLKWVAKGGKMNALIISNQSDSIYVLRNSTCPCINFGLNLLSGELSLDWLPTKKLGPRPNVFASSCSLFLMDAYF